MYYWDSENGFNIHVQPLFQQLLEECTIGTKVNGVPNTGLTNVSVVVRRMYYWDCELEASSDRPATVSVVVRRMYYWDNFDFGVVRLIYCFSSCQKNVLLGRLTALNISRSWQVSVVVRRMYYWDSDGRLHTIIHIQSFSSCQKNVLLGLRDRDALLRPLSVSVVIRRMYYWDFRWNWRSNHPQKFQQLLEECTIGTRYVQQ